MYPDWQFLYWFRSVFWKKRDFVYRDERTGKEIKPGRGKALLWLVTAGAFAGGVFFGKDRIVDELPRRVQRIDAKGLVRIVTQ